MPGLRGEPLFTLSHFRYREDMDAGISQPRKLFDGTVHFEIPVYQRPYVWDEENQWEPLWHDIARLAHNNLDTGDTEEVPGHFLGAVVFKAKAAKSGDVTRFEVVDGQQRLTTLQIILVATADVLAEHTQSAGEFAEDFADEAEAIKELTTNEARRFRHTPAQFKLYPSRGDRDAYTDIFKKEIPQGLPGHRVTQAYNFFRQKITEWIFHAEDSTSTFQRMKALSKAIQSKLLVVSIDLDGSDDDQLIFETLNDRGTPLLKADLIKNWIFAHGDRLKADVEKWADKYWIIFEDEWWREEVRQGRLMRPRIDAFLNYWLVMRTRAEVTSRDLFSAFRDYGNDAMSTTEGAERLLLELRNDAEFYAGLDDMSSEDPVGRFHHVVIQTFDLNTFMPLLLRLASPSYEYPEGQVAVALKAIESWVVRRTLLRETTQDVNRLVVSMLKELEDVPAHAAGDAVVEFLALQSAKTRYWPSDEEVLANAADFRVYGYTRQNRLRVIFGGVEKQLRSNRHEDISLPTGLQIEHIMPRKWRRFWDTDPARNEVEAAEVNKAVDLIGNLTLITGNLNASLSNRPWTDEETKKVSPGGKQPGQGKRSLLSQFSLLAMNKEIVDNHPDEWGLHNITARSHRILQLVCQAWPRPDIWPAE